MATIEELKSNPPKRESVRELLFEVTRGATHNVSYEQFEKLINGVIEIAVSEAVEQCVQRIGCTCEQIDEHFVKVNPACLFHGKNANR